MFETLVCKGILKTYYNVFDTHAYSCYVLSSMIPCVMTYPSK